MSARPPLTFLFDSNAVRNLGSMSEGEWTRLVTAWRRRGFTTAWTPHTLSEVLGTNLDRKDGLTADALAEVQRAVLRFDTLAAGAVLPNVDEVVARSIYEMADVEPPPSPPEFAAEWRAVLKCFLDVRDPALIRVKQSATEVRVAALADAAGSAGASITVPNAGFVTYARERAERMRRALPRRGKRPAAAEVAADIFSEVPYWWRDVPLRLAIPRDVTLKAFTAKHRHLQSAFYFRMIAETVFCHRLATRVTTHVEENDLRDLALTAYFPLTSNFVTDDRRLRTFLRTWHDGRGLLRFREFVTATSGSD